MRLLRERLLQLIPTVLGVTIITFLLLNLLPGDTTDAILGPEATPEQAAQLREDLALDEPLPARYWDWLSNAVTGDLGRSLVTQRSVTSLLLLRVPVTLQLMIMAIGIALFLAIPCAILAAWRPRGVVDRVTSTIAMLGLSIPNFVVAIVLIKIFAVQTGLLPATGFRPLDAGLGPNLRTVIMPALSMSFLMFAIYMRMLRGDLLEQMQAEDYVVTAQAKGLTTGKVLVRHALRNSVYGLLTVVAVNFGTLVGAAVIIESLFGLPGIGDLLVSSIYARDFTVVQGVVVVVAVFVVVANVLADLLYSLIDPRVRYGHPGS